MEKVFKLQHKEGWKTLLLTNDSLLFVNRTYDTLEEFREKYTKKELLKERLELSLLDITKITYPENMDNLLRIFFLPRGKETQLIIIFTTEIEKQNFISVISKPRNMTSVIKRADVLRAVIMPLVGLGFTIATSFVAFRAAEMFESGRQINKSLYKGLLFRLAQYLGSQNILIAGALISALCIYFIYKNYRTRPNEVVYS